MIFNFFASLFNEKTKKSKLPLLDSILLKNLKNICNNNNLSFYQNITIYHHKDSINIPLLILDPQRGIFLFEHKEWSFNDLNNFEVKKSSNNDSSKDTLAFDKINKFITTKFNEILHNDGVDIFNFLLVQNLSYEDYKHLDESKQDLLPYDRIIFNDSDEKSVLSKFCEVAQKNSFMPSKDFILANLFTQYLVFEDTNNINLATTEQIEFIQNVNYKVEVIYGHTHSGKTTSLLLKAILIKLKSSDADISIIEPTTLSCDKLKAKLLNIIEYAIIDIDITSIAVITPSEFKSQKKVAKYILCDDTNLLEDDFLNYLHSRASKSHLSLVNPKKEYKNIFKLTHKFNDIKMNIEFINSNPIASAMQIISDYSSLENTSTLLCISSQDNKDDLSEDLKFFIKDKAVLLDSSKSLIDQEDSHTLLSDYENINAHKADIVLLLDVDTISEDKLTYAINLAKNKVYIIYRDECQKIINLKKILKGYE